MPFMIMTLIKLQCLLLKKCYLDPTAYIYWRTQYGRGGGPIHSKYYRCNGYIENRLSQCISYNETGSRTHSNDVGISCRYGMYRRIRSI